MQPRNLHHDNDGFSFLDSQCGQSLVSVIIAIGIASILMLSMTMMQANQQKEGRALGETLASEDLQKTLIAALTDGSVCTYIVNNPVILTFNSGAVSAATPQVITPTLPIYASIISVGPPVVTGPVVAQVGQPVSAYSQTLYASSITLSISGAPSPMPAPGPGAIFTGNWVVTFDTTKTVRAVKPVQVSTTLTVDTTAPAAAKITGCQTTGGSSSNFTFFNQPILIYSGGNVPGWTTYNATAAGVPLGAKAVILQSILGENQANGGPTTWAMLRIDNTKGLGAAPWTDTFILANFHIDVSFGTTLAGSSSQQGVYPIRANGTFDWRTWGVTGGFTFYLVGYVK